VAGRLQNHIKPNKVKNKIVKLIILVGIMVGGLSYWFNPYDELSLLGISIYKLMRWCILGSLSLTLILNKDLGK
jgi:uncharacterized membrane protein